MTFKGDQTAIERKLLDFLSGWQSSKVQEGETLLLLCISCGEMRESRYAPEILRLPPTLRGQYLCQDCIRRMDS